MSLGPKTVIAIIGSTGVGKTKLSIELAKRLRTEVVNVDAMQMYKGFDIITNKATVEEREAAPHHLIDFVDINREYTVKDFEKDAMDKINYLHNKGSIPILVGGSHYYIQSLLWTSSLIPSGAKVREFGLSPKQADNPIYELKNYWSTLSNDDLYQELIKVDPKMAEHWHVNDRRKVLRSLEIFYESGKPQSEWILDRAKTPEEKKSLRFNTIFFWVYANKPILNSRLDQRVDKMIERGLFDELRVLKDLLSSLPFGLSDYERGIKQAIGFRAFDPYLQALIVGKEDSEIVSQLKKDGLDLMKQQTRQYARKQVLWIKNQLLPLYFSSPQFPTNQEDANKATQALTKLYLLDATDLDSWDVEVRNKSFSILDEVITKGFGPDPLAVNDAASLYLKPPSKTELSPVIATWRKRICEDCSRRIDRKTNQLVDLVVVNGEQEWKNHLRSKGHKRQVIYNRHRALVAQKANDTPSEAESNIVTDQKDEDS